MSDEFDDIQEIKDESITKKENKKYTKKTVQAPKVEDTKKIYIGPNVPKYGIFTNQIYLSTAVGNIAAAMAEYEEIAHLLVEIDGDLMNKKTKLKTAGTLYNAMYSALVKKIGKNIKEGKVNG